MLFKYLESYLKKSHVFEISMEKLQLTMYNVWSSSREFHSPLSYLTRYYLYVLSPVNLLSIQRSDTYSLWCKNRGNRRKSQNWSHIIYRKTVYESIRVFSIPNLFRLTQNLGRTLEKKRCAHSSMLRMPPLKYLTSQSYRHSEAPQCKKCHLKIVAGFSYEKLCKGRNGRRNLDC